MFEKLKIARFVINMHVLKSRTDANLQPRRMNSKGQAMVEFALVLFVAMIVLFVSIQMAFIGQAALALGQMNYQAARYAAVNPTFVCSDVATYMQSNGSPTVVRKGVSCASSCPSSGPAVSAGEGVKVCMSCANSSGTSENCNARTFGDTVQLQLAFDATSVIFLSGNKTSPNFFGIPFPTALTSTETAMSE
jgi:Flp pilus assembly protein TadG